MDRKLTLAGVVVALVVACQPQPPAEETAAGGEPMPAAAEPAPGSPEWKIQNALSAAPPEIRAAATVMDWPATEGGQPTQLRAGTNGWTCFPTTPAVFAAAAGQDPMCLDAAWLAFATAWMSKQTPQITALGTGYMLEGDAGASGSDPFATGPTPDNQWVVSGPHTMIVVPDTRVLEALPAEPSGGGPWVMWKGTAWAHVMMPVAH